MEHQSNEEHEIEEFADLLEHFHDAMLITVGRDGSLHARPMRIAEARPDGDLWFVTSIASTKADEIAANVQCAITMQSRNQYLALSGTAELVRDPARVKELWSDAWSPWFPSGPQTPDLVLIHVEAERAEYWDHSGTKGLRYVLRALGAATRGRRVEPGDGEHHAKLDLG